MIFKIPDSVPNDAVIGAGCALVTAIHGIERAPVEWGEEGQGKAKVKRQKFLEAHTV